MKQVRSILLTSLFILPFSLIYGQLEIIEEIDGSLAVQNILLGEGVEADNITFSGSDEQLGYFNSTFSNIGLEEGIILATGTVQAAIGPNNTTSHTEGGGLPGATDIDLETLAGTEINDAVVLEFDLTASSDSISFRYVFASEEYNEYVCSNFNDAFGFFLSGPGIIGEFENDAINLALIPETDIQVTINTINSGVSGAFGQESYCEESDPNWQNNHQYFIDNSENVSSESVQYDGFTVVLSAKAEVLCGETYHIKLAIGDAFDDNLDSAVFLEASSLSSSNLHVESSIIDANPDFDEALIEACVNGSILLTRPDATFEETISMTISGTATNGVDFEEINDSVVFGENESSIAIPIIPISDEITEGNESIVIEFHYINSCGNAVSTIIEFELLDYIPLTLESSDDINLCPNQATTLSATSLGGVEPISILWSTGDTTESIEVNTAGIYVAQAFDFCQSSTQTEIVVGMPEELELEPLDAMCIGEQFSITIHGGTEPFFIDFDEDLLELNDEGLYTSIYAGESSISVVDQCDIYVELEIVIEDCSMIIPNVFTPNQDGMNDYFRIEGIESYPNSSLIVYNRWGNLVFQSDNYQNNWDGYLASQGTYFYVLERSDGESFKGELSLFVSN